MQLSAAPTTPPPTTSGTGRPISTAYEDNDYSRKAFVEVTGPAVGAPFTNQFASKEAAFAAAAGLSVGTQPALVVRYDAVGPRDTMPWVVEAIQLASPFERTFTDRAGNHHFASWDVSTTAIHLGAKNHSFLDSFLAKAPYVAGVEAIVDGTKLIQISSR